MIAGLHIRGLPAGNVRRKNSLAATCGFPADPFYVMPILPPAVYHDVSLDKVDAGFAITKIALKSEVAVPGIDASTFDGIIQKAKAGCPVSQVLKAEITLDYQLKS